MEVSKTLRELADKIDEEAQDEVAYAITQVRNEYEGYLSPEEAEATRREYYDQGWSDGYEAAKEEK